MAGRVTRRNTYQRDAAEGAGGVLVAGVELAEGGLDGDDEERHGDEGLGDDDAGGGERQREPEPAVEVLAEQAAATERVEQRDAGDDRGQDHRQGAQGAHEAAARETPPGPAATPAARRTATPPTVAHSEHHSDSRSAVSALSEVRIDQASPHGAFHNSPMNGRAKKAMATTARTSAGSGQAFLPDPAVADGDRGVGRRRAHGAPKP